MSKQTARRTARPPLFFCEKIEKGVQNERQQNCWLISRSASYCDVHSNCAFVVHSLRTGRGVMKNEKSEMKFAAIIVAATQLVGYPLALALAQLMGWGTNNMAGP
ncbi:MAG: hypothetical protein KBD66_00385 [Candidatus Doudnabacteria bacterium]|nr:hypothetical protein [Candidatus Doudnabacteria bacterium]